MSTLASELAMRDKFEKTKADDATKEEVLVPEPSNTPKKFRDRRENHFLQLSNNGPLNNFRPLDEYAYDMSKSVE